MKRPAWSAEAPGEAAANRHALPGTFVTIALATALAEPGEAAKVSHRITNTSGAIGLTLNFRPDDCLHRSLGAFGLAKG